MTRIRNCDQRSYSLTRQRPLHCDLRKARGLQGEGERDCEPTERF
jgi:hypothetical protein